MAYMEQLIFVYNADSGFSNGLLDTGRRIFQLKKYPCALCMVTYGPFGMKQDWKDFTATLPSKVNFMHKDEFRKSYPAIKLAEPGLVQVSNDRVITLLDARDFQHINSLDQLEDAVKSAIINNYRDTIK
jgi:hypothetical protein